MKLQLVLFPHVSLAVVVTVVVPIGNVLPLGGLATTNGGGLQPPLAVQVKNTTAFVAHVQVSYPACRTDSFSVNPGATSTPIRRAACRVRKVTANLVGGPSVRGFESPNDGTSDSKFTIVASGAHMVVESAR